MRGTYQSLQEVFTTESYQSCMYLIGTIKVTERRELLRKNKKKTCWINKL